MDSGPFILIKGHYFTEYFEFWKIPANLHEAWSACNWPYTWILNMEFNCYIRLDVSRLNVLGKNDTAGSLIFW